LRPPPRPHAAPPARPPLPSCAPPSSPNGADGRRPRPSPPRPRPRARAAGRQAGWTLPSLTHGADGRGPGTPRHNPRHRSTSQTPGDASDAARFPRTWGACCSPPQTHHQPPCAPRPRTFPAPEKARGRRRRPPEWPHRCPGPNTGPGGWRSPLSPHTPGGTQMPPQQPLCPPQCPCPFPLCPLIPSLYPFPCARAPGVGVGGGHGKGRPLAGFSMRKEDAPGKVPTVDRTGHRVGGFPPFMWGRGGQPRPTAHGLGG